MPTVFSNQLKAILVTEDIINQKDISVSQSKAYTVQHFSYECKRDRTAAGEPFGPTLQSFLDVTVRVPSEDSAKIFFERLYINQPFPYTFLFNATFNGIKMLSECQDALVARGYIVSAREVYDSQMLLQVRILLSKIDYLGTDNNLELPINQD